MMPSPVTPLSVQNQVESLRLDVDRARLSASPGGEGPERWMSELDDLRALWRTSPQLFSTRTITLLKTIAADLCSAGRRAARSTRALVPGADLQGVLEATFGYPSFRPGQRELIEAVLSGRDAVGIMPTGSGKSLTYQLAARVLGGTALVVSPLIALMKDQVDALDQVGLRACMVNSSLSLDQRRESLGRAIAGEVDVIYVAPEGLEGWVGRALGEVGLSLIAVDEAHCISHWGHDFRPAYRHLTGLKQRFGKVPVLALTATATEEVTADIVEQLDMHQPVLIKGSFFRPNLRIQAHVKEGKKTRGEGPRRLTTGEKIVRWVAARPAESGIVYCLSRKTTESVARMLVGRGCRAAAYHAGMDPEERAKVQEAFQHDDLDVVVATIAFGMGIDKSNVRYVIHRDMPRSLDGYTQEIGRAGRDGLPSDCILFYSWPEVLAYDRFAEQAPPEVAHRMRAQAREMYRFARGRGCRHQRIGAHFGERLAPCGVSCDQCTVLEIPEAPAPAAVRSAGKGSSDSECSAAGTPELLVRLKALRHELASAQKVPAYVIFSDATLLAMAERKPASEHELLGISGVGPKRVARYGSRFLAEITGAPLP